MKNMIVFIIVAVVTILFLLFLSAFYERRFLKNRHSLHKAKGISLVAVFAAVAALLMLVEFPLPFLAPGFYKLDLSEVAVLICGFYLGPTAGVICELLKVLLFLLLHGTTSQFIGDFSNFLMGCSMVIPATMIYHVRKSKKSAMVGLAVGTLVMATFGSLLNGLYLLPAYAELLGIPLDAIIEQGTAIYSVIRDIPSFVVLTVLPFNLLKGILVSVITTLLYKRVEKIIFRA